MALGQISLDRDSKSLLLRIAGALEKIADGQTKEQIEFKQYISGGEGGLKEEGHNYVVRFTGCSAEQAQAVIDEMVADFMFEGTVEVQKR